MTSLTAPMVAFLEQVKSYGDMSENMKKMPYDHARGFLEQIMADPAVTGARVEGVDAKDHTISGTEAGQTIAVRVYTPPTGMEKSPGPLPAMLWVHGGGWWMGSLQGYDNTCRKLCASIGVKVVSFNYRLAPENKFPAGLEDCYTALKWLASSAEDWGINPSKLVVAGDSAGCNLAAALALLARQRGGPPIAGQVLLYGQLGDLDEGHSLHSRWRFKKGELNLCEEDIAYTYKLYMSESMEELSNPLACPLLAEDHSGLPPALVIAAEYDVTRDDVAQYAEKLQNAGVRTTFREYPGVLHGFLSFMGDIPEVGQVLDDMASFVDSL